MKYIATMKKVTKREWILLGGAIAVALMVWLNNAIDRQPDNKAAEGLRKVLEESDRLDQKYKDIDKQLDKQKN